MLARSTQNLRGVGQRWSPEEELGGVYSGHDGDKDSDSSCGGMIGSLIWDLLGAMLWG